jgi:hypothetical protein
VDALQYAAGDVLLLFAGGVVETFHRAYDRSFRTPAAWVGVRVTPGKHDSVSFSIGRTDPANPVYGGPDLQLSWDDVQFELAASEEPNVRAFFTQVAQAAGRP